MVQIIGVAWFAVSVVIAVAWALAGKRIFRTPPQRIVRKDGESMSRNELNAVREIIKLDAELRHVDRRGGER